MNTRTADDEIDFVAEEAEYTETKEFFRTREFRIAVLSLAVTMILLLLLKLL